MALESLEWLWLCVWQKPEIPLSLLTAIRTRIDEIANSVTCAMVADIADPDVLENLGISNLDCVVVGVSTDMQASIMATIIAKEKGVPFIVSKAENEMHKHILEKVGADKIVFPEAEMAAVSPEI